MREASSVASAEVARFEADDDTLMACVDTEDEEEALNSPESRGPMVLVESRWPPVGDERTGSELRVPAAAEAILCRGIENEGCEEVLLRCELDGDGGG